MLALDVAKGRNAGDVHLRRRRRNLFLHRALVAVDLSAALELLGGLGIERVRGNGDLFPRKLANRGHRSLSCLGLCGIR